MADPGGGGPWGWRTLGMADPGDGGPEPNQQLAVPDPSAVTAIPHAACSSS